MRATELSPNSITPTLRQVLDKIADLSRTQIMKVRDTNHVANFRDLCSRQVRDFVVNLSRTLSQTSRHVEMVCVRDLSDLCPRLSPRGSFGESWSNGIWALVSERAEFIYVTLWWQTLQVVSCNDCPCGCLLSVSGVHLPQHQEAAFLPLGCRPSFSLPPFSFLLSRPLPFFLPFPPVSPSLSFLLSFPSPFPFPSLFLK